MSDCNDELASYASLCTMDERQTALLSVSVTFKSQENLETDVSTESTKIPEQSQGKDDSDDVVHEEESLCKIERNATPSTTITSSETKVKNEIRMKSKATTNTEILPVSLFCFLSYNKICILMEKRVKENYRVLK